MLYPATATTILRTWVCDEYTANDGTVTKFLSDDTAVECSYDPGSPYVASVGLAIAMVVILIIGVPMLQLLLLWKWTHPFQRLYVPSEEGEWLSNPTAKRLLGALYSTYKPEAYMGALASTLIKLILTAVVGLAFNEAQGTGTRRLVGST